MRPQPDSDRYEFSHSLISQYVYTDLNPSRRIRLHRQIALELERCYADQAGEHAAQIAYHYCKTSSLPGADRWIAYCLLAADRAESAAAHSEAAEHLRGALQLLSDRKSTPPQVLARLGLALAWSGHTDEALRVTLEASTSIADTEGPDAASSYLAEAADAIRNASRDARTGQLA